MNADPAVPIVELTGITKLYAGVQALDRVDLRVERGTVHALVGENGAGKSTLGKVIAGEIRPDAGEMRLDGELVSYRNPHQALVHGVTAIQQEISLLRRQSVLTNVFLGSEPRRRGLPDTRAMAARFAELDEMLRFGLAPDAIAGRLSVADQQKVEIMRALARGGRLIVMDEPTAALSGAERHQLLDVIRDLRDRGTTIVYVSHNLQDVMSLADTITVMRNGCRIVTTPVAEATVTTLVTAMLGRSLESTFPPREPVAPAAPVVLSARGLTRRGAFEDVDVTVRAGEIVAIAGLVGSGRTEVARAIFGADPFDAGHVEICGEPLKPGSVREAVRSGVAMLPEDRKRQGLLMRMRIRDNVTLVHLGEAARAGVVRRGRERGWALALLRRLDVRPAVTERPVKTLSGGNQQKVLFGKWLIEEPRLLIVDEPTRGVDIGARAALYQLIADEARRGLGILMVSSELEEVLGLAHRILVMRHGRVVTEIDGEQATEQAVMHAAFGMPQMEAINP